MAEKQANNDQKQKPQGSDDKNEMEKVQEDAAEKREEEGGYQ